MLSVTVDETLYARFAGDGVIEVSHIIVEPEHVSNVASDLFDGPRSNISSDINLDGSLPFRDRDRNRSGLAKVNDPRERPALLVQFERREVVPAVTDGSSFEVEDWGSRDCDFHMTNMTDGTNRAHDK